MLFSRGSLEIFAEGVPTPRLGGVVVANTKRSLADVGLAVAAAGPKLGGIEPVLASISTPLLG